MNFSLHELLASLATLLAILIIASDLYARRVPNAWLLTALLIGFGSALVTWVHNSGTGGSSGPSLLGLLIGLAVLLPLHIFGWMGAGDVKFFAVLGFLLGAKALLPIWAIGSLIAGAHAVLILLSRHWVAQATPYSWQVQSWLSTSALGRRIVVARQGRKGLPYAAWLGVGALITAFNPELMHW